MKEYPNFDRIVFCYDFLKKLVFGNSVDKAQVEFLSYIPHDASILIIGGGTGEILIEILKYPRVKAITYLEYSGRMMAAAKRRLNRFNNTVVGNIDVTFVNGSVELLIPTDTYDVVITPFVLDGIEAESLDAFMGEIDKHLVPSGFWLFSDFCSPRSHDLVAFCHRVLIEVMFSFFAVTTGLKGKSLPDFDNIFIKINYIMLASEFSSRGLIQSKVWQKRLVCSGDSSASC